MTTCQHQASSPYHPIYPYFIRDSNTEKISSILSGLRGSPGWALRTPSGVVALVLVRFVNIYCNTLIKDIDYIVRYILRDKSAARRDLRGTFRSLAALGESKRGTI